MDSPSQFLAPDPLVVETITVSSGQTLSSIIECKGFCPVALATPAELTSASAKLHAGADGDDLRVAMDRDGTDYAITLAATKYILLPAADFSGIIAMRLELASAEAADRSFQIFLRKLG